MKDYDLKRVGISLPPDTYEKLEEKRGPVNRSSYIREVLKKWWESNHTLEDLKGGSNSE